MTGNRKLVLLALLVPTSLLLIRFFINRDTPESKLYSQKSQAKHFINEGKFSEGLALYLELSKKGIPGASYSVAQIYSEGWGVQRNRTRAEDYLKIFIRQESNLCEGVPKLSSAYQLMARDNRDPEEKRFWRKKAIDAGYQDSKCPLNYAFTL